MNTRLNLLNAQLQNIYDVAVLDYSPNSPKLQALKLAISVDSVEPAEGGTTPTATGEASAPNWGVSTLSPELTAELDDDDSDYDDDDDEETPLPQGFRSEEEYQEFLVAQGDTDPLTGEVVRPETVAGLLVDEETGEAREVGNLAESVATAREAVLNAVDEETGESIPVADIEGTFVVRYTRLDGEELTDNDVRTIIDSPNSAALKQIGDVTLLSIAPTNEANVKDAVFEIGQNDHSLPLLALHNSIVKYQGTVVIPGVGLVSGRGRVDAN